jgi:hypothetical protein
MPREQEMVPKDKYTIFDKKERKYRKGIHSKWRGSFGLFDWGYRCFGRRLRCALRLRNLLMDGLQNFPSGRDLASA